MIRSATEGVRDWEDRLPSFALNLVANSHFTACACKDGTVYVWTRAGRRLLPCMMLDAPAAFLACNGAYLASVTCTGIVDVWCVLNIHAY